MAEIVTATAAAVTISKEATNVTSSLSKVWNYEKNLDENRKMLDEAVEKLSSKRDDLLAKVSREKTKQPTKQCKSWLDKAKKIQEGVQILEKKYAEEKQHQSSFISFLMPEGLSKSMVKKTDELKKLLADVPTETEILIDRLPRPVVKNETPKIEDKPSLYRVFQQVLKFLADKDIKRVGLWGTVGIGKTAIMRNLKESKEVAKMFDTIIFVTVTEERNIPKLQHEIAEQLGLDVEGIINTRTVASTISEELKRKNYLLLLDDVWGRFELSEIGVVDNGHDGKVVVASRNSASCRYVDVDDIVTVNRLSDDDALKLFQESLGYNINPMFKSVARQIIRECDKLPILIDRVARTFREIEQDINLWRTKLKRLRIYPDINDQAMDDVLGLLRFCFEELNDEDEKFCFLYGALFPENCDIYMDHLMECWSAEGLIKNVKELTARNRGLEILHHLINLSLLESSEKVKHIRINKVIRKMALKISSESQQSKCLVIVVEELSNAPDAENWTGRKWISLMDNKLCTLPRKPYCSNLSTLFLQRNADLIGIPESFFELMGDLRVLDLHSTGITKLPSSMSCLKSLRALYLNSCRKLQKLSSKIKAFEHLEILDIRGSGVNALPSEIGSLGGLQSLRISILKFDKKLKKVEFYRKVFQKLSFLEELVIDVPPGNQSCHRMAKVIIEGAATLTKLTRLSCTIGKFQSSCKCEVVDYDAYEICKCLKYANGDGQDSAISEVLAESNAFELIGHKGTVALSDFSIKSFSNIKSCLIESCDEMKTIFNGEGITEPALACLETMHLCNIPKLESLWEGPIQIGSLAELTTLVIFKCSNLKKIFPSSLIQHLSKLEHLEVEACDAIEEIAIESDNSGLGYNVLPKLEMLVLTDLLVLQRICLGNRPSLEKRINKCPRLEIAQ